MPKPNWFASEVMREAKQSLHDANEEEITDLTVTCATIDTKVDDNVRRVIRVG